MFRQFLHCIISILLMLALAGFQVIGADNQGGNTSLRTPPIFLVIIDISGSMNDRFPAPVQPILTDATKLMDVKRRLGMLAEHLPEGTRVLVTVFDHDANQLCDLTLDQPTSRSNLRKVFSEIKSRDSSTNLWTTLDAQLTLAKTLVDAKPESRVRVLLYSDGEDSNKQNPINHETLVKKFGNSLQSTVRLDWISIGYDLRADVKSVLQKNGVQFSKPETPDELYPLIAGFKLSKQELVAGELLQLEDESTGFEITKRGVDWGDNTTSAVTKFAEHRYTNPGTYKLRYRILTNSGRTNEATTSIAVLPSPLSETVIRTSSAKLLVDEKLRVQDASRDMAKSHEWLTSDGQRSQTRDAEFSFSKPGTYQIRLLRAGEFGQKSEAMETVQVGLPPKPPAEFRLGGKLQTPGDSVALLNESGETAVRYQWKLNGKSWSTEKHPSLTADNYGSYVIELTVYDRWHQSSVATHEYVLPRPDAPVADFDLPASVLPDERLVLVEKSTGNTNTPSRWLLDGVEIGHGTTVECQPATPGEHHVSLVSSGPGGKSKKTKTIQVRNYPPPVAAFSVGVERIFVGDQVRVMDASTGRIDSVKFSVEINGEPFHVEFDRQSDSRSFELPSDRVGTLTIRQTTTGPGGESTSQRTVTIDTRSVQPLADFELDRRAMSSELTKVRLLSKCKGTVERLEFDPGDGSPTLTLDPTKPIEHDYKPGKFVARVTTFPPADSQLRPSTWSSVEIQVAHPWPTWIKNLVWQVPAILAVLMGSTLVWSRISKNRIVAQQKRISGHLSIFDSRQPLSPRSVEFSGIQPAETVDLDSMTKVTVRSVDDGLVAYQLDVEREGIVSQTFDLSDSEDVEIDNYRLTYTA